MAPGRGCKSDQKASTLLIDKLLQLKQKTKQESPIATSSREKDTKIDKHHPKITGGLNKRKQVHTKSPMKTSSQRKNPKTDEDHPKENKMKALNITVSKSSKSGSNRTSSELAKKTKKSKSLKKHSSFETYGIAIPSYEDIVASHKMYDEHKESVRQLDVFDDELLERSVPYDGFIVEEFKGELLDCYHLPIKKLDKAFQRHRLLLTGIINGSQYSDRHNLYHRKPTNLPNNLIKRDLRCCPSIVVFTQEQIYHLLKLLSSEFDPDDMLYSYLFKVLLPELCLLIFMDEHNMNRSEADSYLDKRPVM